MKKSDAIYYSIIVILVFGCFVYSCTPKPTTNNLASKTKVALRQVGHQILLSQQDSTSLVLPVQEVRKNVFQLNFENNLGFDPKVLQLNIEESFLYYNLPESYRVEVLQCENYEVGYSYEMLNFVEEDVVACHGRTMPKNCYTVELTYTSLPKEPSSNRLAFYGLVSIVILFLVVVFYSRYSLSKTALHSKKGKVLGSFSFYPDLNILVKEAQEIPLSKKECELLAIFIEHPNQVIKREILTKRVWEDNGVIVSRSLDTYISKLRKKLQEDTAIKITNVHGIGYKLEYTI